MKGGRKGERRKGAGHIKGRGRTESGESHCLQKQLSGPGSERTANERQDRKAWYDAVQQGTICH